MQGPHAQGPPTGQGPPSTLKLSGLPPLDCCILYGSSYYQQRPAGERGAPQPQEQRAAGEQGGPLKQRLQASLGAPLNDMLLLVPQQRLLQWHTDNLKQHASHYGPLIRLVSAFGGPPRGASFAARLTQASGVPVLFNCRVPLEEAAPGNEGLCKYGVVPTEALIDDLRTWRHFYFAGRMQKPVSQLWALCRMEEREFACLPPHQVYGVVHVQLRLALLLLPEEASLKRLFEEVVSLSYRGDVRMLVAEDPDKVSAIVRGQAADLCAIYLPLLAAIPSAHLELSWAPFKGGPQGELPLQQDRLWELLENKLERVQHAGAAAVAKAVETGALRIRHDRSAAALSALYVPLPASFRSSSEACESPLTFTFFTLKPGKGAPRRPLGGPQEGAPKGTPAPPATANLKGGLQRLVFWPALKCSVKNAVAAGVSTSMVYGLRKVGKRLRL
ncbi:hypothetical protein Esti_002977 [Eimeria stiedai]